MKHPPLILVLLLFASAAVGQTRRPGDGQALPQPPLPAPTARVSEPELAADVRVTGCLRLWDASIGALPGQPSSGPRYLLVDVRQEDNPGNAVVVLRRYVVTADPSVNLAGHIDQVVRVSGNVAPLVAAPRKPADLRPGEEGTRPGEISAPVDDAAADDTWLSISASAIARVAAACAARQ